MISYVLFVSLLIKHVWLTITLCLQEISTVTTNQCCYLSWRDAQHWVCLLLHSSLFLFLSIITSFIILEKKPFTGKKVKRQQRRIPLHERQKQWMSCDQMNRVTELWHIQWIWQKLWIIGRRHGPPSRPPRSMKQEEEGRRGISGAVEASRKRPDQWGQAFEAGGTDKEAGPLGRRPGAGCRKQGQGGRTQDW